MRVRGRRHAEGDLRECRGFSRHRRQEGWDVRVSERGSQAGEVGRDEEDQRLGGEGDLLGEVEGGGRFGRVEEHWRCEVEALCDGGAGREGVRYW